MNTNEQQLWSSVYAAAHVKLMDSTSDPKLRRRCAAEIATDAVTGLRALARCPDGFANLDQDVHDAIKLAVGR